MFKRVIVVLSIGVLALAACGPGGKPVPQLPNTRTVQPPAITRPGEPATGAAVPPTQPAPTAPPATLPPTRTVKPLLPAGTPAPVQTLLPKALLTMTAFPRSVPPVTVQSVTRVAEYDAAQAITTYARDVLGLSVQVLQAGGARGKLTLPPFAEQSVRAAASLAGVTYFGRLENGEASVSLGQGSVSGDMTLDIQSASLGAFSLARREGMPDGEGAALDLIKQTFPGIAGLEYAPFEAEQGYAFVAASSHEGIDWQTRQASVIFQGVLVGVMPLGRAQTAVYAIVGSGTLAALISLQ